MKVFRLAGGCRGKCGLCRKTGHYRQSQFPELHDVVGSDFSVASRIGSEISEGFSMGFLLEGTSHLIVLYFPDDSPLPEGAAISRSVELVSFMAASAILILLY